MKKEGIFIEVWVVTHYNTIEGTNDTNVFASCGDATANFDEVVNEAIKSASVEIGDFRVSKKVNSLTIYDIEDDRVVIMCEVTKRTIQCGIMCM